MAKVWSHFFVMLWVLFIISSGIYLFSRGFLLSRRVRTEHNQCIQLKRCDSDESEEPNCLNSRKVDEIFNDVNSSSEYCLPKKTRIILIVIDALKYEFGLFDKNKESLLPHENNLPVFDQLLTKYPHNARFMKLVADAPTTTLQRLKGITTGSLPTFIDVGSNFATAEINEDNIIDQIIRNNMSSVFIGDSTWTDLFPKRFVRQYSYPSFDIFDLDTVDNAINEVLPYEMKQNDWSLLIAHYLGVDHCGHKYGPVHPEMTRKLSEMNAMVEFVIDQMDDETTLFVIGDHGMTKTGDHGGDTKDEINTMIFTYSKKYSYLTDSGKVTMDQIDVTPTIATILGVPIPFSNLGATNFDIVPDVHIPNLNRFQTQILHTWQNTKQMHLYFHSYAGVNEGDEIPTKLLDNYLSQFHIFSLRIAALYKDDAMESFCQDVRNYLKEIANDCRQIWAQFDANLMSQGLILTAITTFFLFLLTTNLKFAQFGLIFSQLNLGIIYVTNILLIVGTPFVHNYLGWEWSIIDVLRYTCIYGVALLAFLLIQNWDFIAANWSTQQHFCNLFTRSIFIVAVSAFFSNSYIIYEQKVLCYLLCGALAVFLYKVRKEYACLARLRKLRPELIFHSSFFKLATFTIVALLLLRSSYNWHRCREEHGNCIDSNSKIETISNSQNAKPLKTNTMSWIDLLPILKLAVFATFSRKFLAKCGNLTGYSPHVVFANFGPIVAAVACSVHFFTSLSTKLMRGVHQMHIDGFAWIVYSVFIIQIMIVATRPLMLFIVQKPNRTFNISPFGCVVPQIVMKMKQMYDNAGSSEQGSQTDDIPIVYGLATVYSSIICSICVGFTFVLALLLGPRAANGIFVILIVAALILVLNAIHRYQRSTRLAFCLQPEVLALVSWHLLAHYSFYATSHQPTLSQISWHAAFVGRTAKYDHNNIISAILVLLNTFGGQFLICALYPLLVIAPSSLYTIYPSLAPRRTSKMVIKNQNGTKQREIVKKITDDLDNGTVNVTTFAGLDSENEHLEIHHGELALYENDDLFFGQLYKTATQLIILQAIRIFCSMIACTIHCRHLMVWKIFAPRFIFEGIATFVVFGAILIGFLIIVRIHKAVTHLISVMSDANKYRTTE